MIFKAQAPPDVHVEGFPGSAIKMDHQNALHLTIFQSSQIESYGRFTPILRFILNAAEPRDLCAERWCFRQYPTCQHTERPTALLHLPLDNHKGHSQCFRFSPLPLA
jgi:hypothetical protein